MRSLQNRQVDNQIANYYNFAHAPEDDAEGKYLEEHARPDRQVLLLASHRQRGEGEGAIVEDERRRSHPRVGELEVLVEIVQAVEEVPHVSSQDREHAIVTVLTDESYEVHAHLIEELLLRHAEYLRFSG